MGKPWAAYEVWAGETDYTSPDVLLSIDQYDYVKLGDSDGQTMVFPGDHTYYVIAVRQRHVVFDAVQGSDSTYYDGGLETSNVFPP